MQREDTNMQQVITQKGLQKRKRNRLDMQRLVSEERNRDNKTIESSYSVPLLIDLLILGLDLRIFL